jgi:hypothetical protein
LASFGVLRAGSGPILLSKNVDPGQEVTSMQSWIELDEDRGQVLVRQGVGTVTAVVNLSDSADPAMGLVRVEMDCPPPPGRPRAIRFRVRPVAAADSPLAAAALQAVEAEAMVEWTVRWVRHDWVPTHLPITSLDLATDTVAALTGLVLQPRPQDAVDAEWVALLADGSAEPS